MANDIDQSVRSDLSTKQSQIKVTAGREPSIPELTENKPVMRYVPGKGLMMYVRYNNKRYHVKFSDDPKQEGRIRVEDVGQPEIRSNQVFSTGQGGTGQDLTGETGAISISSGTVAAGTLPIAVGGTNATDSDTWLNTRVVMKANGVLGYDASAVACTMNTLADGGNIRSRVTAGLDSSGNVDRVVAIAKGGTNATANTTWLNTNVTMNTDGTLEHDGSGDGNPTMNTLTDGGSIRSRITAGLASNGDVNRTVSTAKGGLGADFSGTATGFIRIINGTAAQRAYADAKSDMSLDNVANERQINTFAQDGIPTSVAAGDIWVDTDDDNKVYRAAAAAADAIEAGGWILVTPGKGSVGLGSADNLSAADIRAGTTKANVGLTDVDDLSAADIRSGTTAANVGLNLVANERQINTFVASSSGTIPTAVAAGDLWIDSGVDNKLYRAAAAGADAITGGEWVLVQAGKTAVGLPNVANVDQTDASNITSGTLSNTVQDNITRVGTVANGTWEATAVAVDKGGTGAITAAAAKASLSAATTFRQTGIPTALAAGDIWIDTDANNKQYRATAAGDDAITSGEWEEVTIEAAGMDAVAGVVIYSDPITSGTSDDDERALSASTLWVQSGTTATAKISINYYHESANESMKLACHLCTADGARAASVSLGVYPVTTGGSLTTGSTPNMSSASAGPTTKTTTKITFDGTIVTDALDITGLTNNVLYKVVVLLNNADASTNTLMTSPTIIVYGS